MPLDDGLRALIGDANDAMAARAQRVLAVARKTVTSPRVSPASCTCARTSARACSFCSGVFARVSSQPLRSLSAMSGSASRSSPSSLAAVAGSPSGLPEPPSPSLFQFNICPLRERLYA